jgi:magnesium transporter
MAFGVVIMNHAELDQAQKMLWKLIRLGSLAQVRNGLRKMHPADVAGLFPHLRATEQLTLIDLLFEEQLAARTLKALPENLLKELLEKIEDQKLAMICTRLSPDDAVDFLGYLPEERKERILGLIEAKPKQELETLLLYPEDTAGGIMTTDFVALPEYLTVRETMEFLRQRKRGEDVFYVYVVDARGHLVGVLPLRNLVFWEPEQRLREVMIPNVVRVQTTMQQEEVAHVVAQYDLLAVPVVDEENKLVGVITVDDVIDVIEEEATEDMYHLANLDTDEHVFTPVLRSVRLRCPWLLVNLATAILAALTVSLFEETISQYVALAVMMPIVAGMGGNAGTQSLTVVVRGLALGELDFSQGAKALFKEIRVGLLNGIVNGVVMGVIAYVWYHNLWLAMIMFFAMIANLVIAGLFGALVPLGLRWAKLDPALGSSIFVTTATDVGGFLVFLGLATMLLRYLK